VPQAQRPNPALLVTRDDADARRVLRGDLATGALHELYRSARGTVDDLQVAPNDGYVVLIETTEGKQQNGEYVVPPRNRLLILRPDGTTLRAVEADVRVYSVSPDGARLAYITGTYYEGGAGFKPNGAFLLDLASGRVTRVEGADLSVELNWVSTPEENALYLKTLDARQGTVVRRFDVERGRLETTPSPAFRISPDGRYYMMAPYETIESGRCEAGSADDSCLRVYERSNNRSIPFFQTRAMGTQVGWVYGQGHALLFTKREAVKVDQQVQRGNRTLRGRLVPQVRDAENTIYDVESRQVLERFRGVVGSARESTWIASPRTLVVRNAAVAAPAAPVLEGLTLRRVSPSPRLPPNVIAKAGAPETMTLQPGADLPGGDYRTVAGVLSPEGCEAECAADARCRAFTFARPETRGQPGRCFLKSSVPAARPDRRFVAGTKVPRGQ
jgi:hypothetical protein